MLVNPDGERAKHGDRPGLTGAGLHHAHYYEYYIGSGNSQSSQVPDQPAESSEHEANEEDTAEEASQQELYQLNGSPQDRENYQQCGALNRMFSAELIVSTQEQGKHEQGR